MRGHHRRPSAWPALLIVTASAAVLAVLALLGAAGADAGSVSVAYPSPSSVPMSSGPTASPSATRSDATPPAAGQSDRPAPSTVLALGDSVPAGTACGCTPYVTLVARQIATAYGRKVEVINDAVPGLDSSGLLTSLQTDDDVISDVRSSDVIIVTIGANDLSYQPATTQTCGTSASCYQEALQEMTANVEASVERIQSLTAGRHARILLTGYWNVWQDGAVARSMGSDFVRTSRAVTAAANADLQDICLEHHVTYVDLWRSFGVGHSDDTDLLAPDGDHPDAAGHQLIATAIIGTEPDLVTPGP